MSSQLAEHNTGYRQGVVLGLTMAEVLILLVFVLLLVAGGMIDQFQKANDLQRQHITSLEDKLAKADVLSKELDKFKDIKATPEDVRIAVAIVENLRQSLGKDPKEMIETIEKLSKQVKASAPEIPQDWQKLVKESSIVDQHGGIDHLVNADEQMQELTELLKKKGYSVDDSKTLSDIIGDNVEVAGRGRSNEWPPMIRLSEADGHFFPLGKAGLPPEFESYLVNKIVPILLDNLARYEVDVIEVVGHTDQVHMNIQPSNLDTDLRDALLGKVPVDELVSGDNAGLGIARAVAVARILLNDPRLKEIKGIRILPLSGAQLTTLDENLDTDPKGVANVKERRRIEIRLRRSTKAQTLPTDQ